VIWDILGGAAFVLGMAAIMGVFSRKPRTWGYPPVRKQGSLLGVVLPEPRDAAEDAAEHKVD
jgi:hypothetical protein